MLERVIRAVTLEESRTNPNVPKDLFQDFDISYLVTDVDYWVKRPSAAFFADCCNEFWWVSTYVAKGLWRREILYALDHLNRYVRPMLLTMLEWKVGIQTDFSISVGKNSKYLEKYLSEQCWESLLSTYADGSYEGSWKALFTMGELFRSTAKYVADHLHYTYPQDDDQRVTAFLKHVQTLPLDATKIY
ncbi:aminoglycoside adenylyltransferase [Brevibacillus laterosporus]|nr:aminoglycoside 6-adenylyltransferase [Brevibacillus laterosporus]RJL14614.1 aminoglycoside adenylyltransferase [Brevibacillus laterosporus]TPH09574.1 aminoglycoside adenylyltransferase [Brevibacillus laterosporus]